jgi:hypothetical protein
MSAAQYEEGLITAARVRAQQDSEIAKKESDAAQAAALGQRKQASQDYLTTAQNTIGQRKNLSGMLDNITQQTTDKTIQNLNKTFGGTRGRMLDEQAAVGGVGQPNSRFAMGQLEGVHSSNISDAINQIQLAKLNQQYAGENQSISDLLNAQAQAEQIGRGYQQTALEESSQLRAIDQANRQASIEEALAPYIGGLQANAKKPGTLDYLNTAISGLSLIPQGIAAANKG